MINTSKDIIILTEDDRQLRTAIVSAVEDVKQLHEKLHGAYLDLPAQNRVAQFGFLREYDRQLRNARVDSPEHALRLLMQACLMRVPDRSSKPIADAFGYDSALCVPPTQYSALFRGAATILLRLWRDGYIVLNPFFAPNLKYEEELAADETETLRDIDSCVRSNPRYVAADVLTIKYYSKRLFWATNWTTWDRFDISEMATMHARWLKAKRDLKNGDNHYPIPAIPFRILLQLLRGELAEKSGVEEEAINGYQEILDLASENFRENRPGAQTGDPEALFQNWHLVPSPKREESAIFWHLRNVRQAGKNEGKRWPGATEPREMWEDLPLRECGQLWVELFEGYLNYWHERYESDNKLKGLQAFSDYLFLYLNWWHEKHAISSRNFPAKPGAIERFFHIKKGAIATDELRPMSFASYLAERYDSPGRQAVAMRAAKDFFDWVIEEFSGTPEQANLFDQGFQNPIRDKDVHHRNGNKRLHSRARLSRRHSTAFTEYLLAVEAFYTKLEQDCFSGQSVGLPMQRIPVTVEAEKYGFVPVIFIHGKTHPIEQVPMVHQRHDTDFLTSFGMPRGLPNLSGLRLLCFMMETGLRGAHIRWLDRERSPVDNNPKAHICKRVWINTDKAGDAFLLPVSDVAHSLLTKQRETVDRIIAGRQLTPTPYMGREHSRFDDVNTLFCGSGSTEDDFRPISDTSYRKLFKVALATFSVWRAQATGEEVDLVQCRDSFDLCELLEGSRNRAADALESIHTPHSIRSTIISERISVLPIRLVGQLVGHQNEATTAYYHQPDEEHLYQVLNGLPVPAAARFGFRSDDPCYVQAGSPSSSLARAWKQYPKEAEVAYGLTAFTFGTAAGEDGPSGLQSLRDAADSEIAYLDTNICPFAGRCPKDVLDEIGEPNRCGICRYAVKSVEQLPAIQAKIRLLEDRSRRLGKQSEKVLKSGSLDEAQRLSDKADMDATEAVGWHLAEAVLENKLTALRSGQIDTSNFHVDSPDILRFRLEKIALPDSDAARLLLRISESNAYPSMQDEVIKQIASRIKRKMRGSDEPLFEYDPDPVGELCSYISARMEVQGLTTTDVIQQLESHQELITHRISSPSPIKQLIHSED